MKPVTTAARLAGPRHIPPIAVQGVPALVENSPRSGGTGSDAFG